MTQARETRTAFVGECPDLKDLSRYAARFTAHWESEDGQEFQDGPQDASLDDALAWARAHARAVFVTLGGEDQYSAGEIHPEASVPRWPVGGILVRPRLDGTPYDGSVTTRMWELRAFLDGTDESENVPSKIQTAVSRDPDIVGVEAARTPHDGVCVRFEMRGADFVQMSIAAETSITAALARDGIRGEVVRIGSRSWWND